MPSYVDHISEVFIKPIRSVLAVDDLFPTLDDLLAKGTPHTNDANSERLSKLLQFCRTTNPEWLVDVHNGKGIGEGASPLATMRQCSWLILDYKLDGESGDGSRSISALRALAGSDSFNLVAIYTADKADVVFREVVVALSDLADNISLTDSERAEVELNLREWEDSEPEIEDLLGKAISGSACLEFLKNGNALVKNTKNLPVLAAFNQLVKDAGGICKVNPQLLLNYFVRRHLSKVIPDGARTFHVNFSADSAQRKWIYARNIFISIEEKTTDPALLLDGLISSLAEWQPSPNQLIIAKLRAELEASGMILDREVVKDKDLQAFWLHALLDANPLEEAHHVGALVDRQSEILGDRLRVKLVEFTASVIENLKKEGSSLEVTKKYLGVDPSAEKSRKNGIVAHNTHVSTKPPSGKNLTSGHIVKVEEQSEATLWICLSPACDLEAGRTGGRDIKVLLHPWMPVTFLKLQKIKEQKALELATRGWVLFLDIDGGKEQFSYYPNADAQNNPIWEELFVRDDGRLLSGNSIKVARIRKLHSFTHPSSAREFVQVGGTLIPKGEDLPIFEEFGATVVAQLRTEYTASLTQRFTAHLSRIGLDYYGIDQPPSKTK